MIWQSEIWEIWKEFGKNVRPTQAHMNVESIKLEFSCWKVRVHIIMLFLKFQLVNQKISLWAT